MGALHKGHVSLVERCRTENELLVCSIFVNPTQFNDPKDFRKYPITLENDIYLLEKAGCDALFLPAVEEIYPGGASHLKKYELGSLELILEGEFRPGHFQGVCQVVHRLLDIVQPNKLYLGQKDFQQCMVIRELTRLVGIRTDIVICPTQREKDGLAMSSRNLRMNADERERAPRIYDALLSIRNGIKPGSLAQLSGAARQLLEEAGFKVDYVAIALADTLEITDDWDGRKPLVALVAAYLNEIRLIDNMLLQANRS